MSSSTDIVRYFLDLKCMLVSQGNALIQKLFLNLFLCTRRVQIK